MNAIILAAGKGTRMHSELPKCAYPFLGKPMVQYIVEACLKSNVDNIYVVVGYKKEEVMNSLTGYNVNFCVQEKQEGTGSAVKCCKDLLFEQDGLTLILPGDIPLVDSKIIKELIFEHKKNGNSLTVASTIMDDAKQYGRIYREGKNVKKIVEAKDATSEILAIKEINSGIFCVDNKLLFESLENIINNNKAHEYYLTDIVEIIGDKHKVDTYVVKDNYKLEGFNDLESMHQAENFMKKNNLI